MARNRIIYASQSVWVDGEVLYRVQALGTSTSFTSEDIYLKCVPYLVTNK